MFYYNTFARVCLLPYIGGTILHILRLIYDFPIHEIPWVVDWVIVVLGGYGGLGLIIFIKKIIFKNIWDKIAYGLLLFHLNGSVIIHAYILLKESHSVLTIFPYWYSCVAVAYFIMLGMYVINLNKRLYHIDRAKK